MAYIASNKNQNWLLPLSIKDMIPEDHICFLVEEFAESLDYSNFDMIYDGAGHPAYHPKIIMKILNMGMLLKVRSSRKLSRACRENFVFMYLAEKVCPDFRTIARFRKDNPEFVKDAFKKTVELASENNLADLSFISIDGSMLKANASKKKYFDNKNLDKLDKAIDKMVEEDIKIDELEEELFGDNEEGLTGIDKRDLRRIVRDHRKSENKKKIKKNLKKAKGELEKYCLKKVYGLRKITVEPVYGNIKANLGFREFLLRGLEKVKIELNLVCIAHNLQKIWRLRTERRC